MSILRLFPDTVYVPTGFPRPCGDVNKEELREKLFELQKGLCIDCGKLLDKEVVDIHEALVTKGNVQGWPKPWRIIIVNVYNCVLVHRSCHGHSDSELVWKHKCDLFGENEVRKWYDSLPFKKHPRRF